jgi:general secretion pathway protein M
MTADRTPAHYPARYRTGAVAAYVVLIFAFLMTIWVALVSLYQTRLALADSLDILSKLEARQQKPGAVNAPAGAVPPGSPFIGGETITVGGAALLQRVASAITHFGGTVQSSQVDLQGPHAKDGFITLVISCEMEQPNLQNLLYDLEAGMPFLFIDQLSVQGPRKSVAAGGDRMQILIAVTGQWKGTK